MKITEYWIATANSQKDLLAKIREAMGEGWQPLGGVAIRVYSVSEPSTWAQAMVRYESNTSTKEVDPWDVPDERGITLNMIKNGY